MKTHVKERLYSLDALRGFDMFWIVGGGSILRSLARATNWQWAELFANHTYHP